MSLVMHVDTAAWRSHQDAVLASDRLTVPVIKGNGYGFGLERLAGKAARLTADVVAVGRPVRSRRYAPVGSSVTSSC